MSNAVLVRDDFRSRTAPGRAQHLAMDAIVASLDRYPDAALDYVAVELVDHLSFSKWLDSSQTTDLPLVFVHAHAHVGMTHISGITGRGGAGGAGTSVGGSGGTLVAPVAAGGGGGTLAAPVVTGGSGGTLAAQVGVGGSGTQLGLSCAYWSPVHLQQYEPQNLVYINACMNRAVWRLDDAFNDLDSKPLLSDERSADRAVTVEKIDASLKDADEESVEAAKLSVAQAIEYVRSNKLSGRPRVMMSDDGVLTLQWRNEALGAALIFTGDGTVSVALKDAEKSYSETLEDVALDAAVPPAFVSIVEAISR